jgi:hypothetical protein
MSNYCISIYLIMCGCSCFQFSFYLYAIRKLIKIELSSYTTRWFQRKKSFTESVYHYIPSVIKMISSLHYYMPFILLTIRIYSSFLLELLKKTYCSFLLANYGQLEMSDVFDSLHRKYGDILKLRMGAEHAIIISHPDYTEQIFRLPYKHNTRLEPPIQEMFYRRNKVVAKGLSILYVLITIHLYVNSDLTI